MKTLSEEIKLKFKELYLARKEFEKEVYQAQQPYLEIKESGTRAFNKLIDNMCDYSPYATIKVNMDPDAYKLLEKYCLFRSSDPSSFMLDLLFLFDVIAHRDDAKEIAGEAWYNKYIKGVLHDEKMCRIS